MTIAIDPDTTCNAVVIKTEKKAHATITRNVCISLNAMNCF